MGEKTYLLEHNGDFVSMNLQVNKRGFYKHEIENIMQDNKFKHYNVTCIDDEIKKYHLHKLGYNKWGLSEEVFHYKLWYEAYLDNNLKGFSLPIKVDTNNEYKSKLEKKLSEYINYLNRPAFVYQRGTLDCIKKVCELILKALDSLINGNEETTDDIVGQVLSLFKEDPFLISELDKSYSFRGVAPFIDLQSKGYDKVYNKMMNENLTFYRVRTRKAEDKEDITDIKHMLHIPYNLRDKASSMRFSPVKFPGLYLGTTTYVCSKECKWNKKDELYASVFIPNSRGKKFKILNLTISQALINGIYNRYNGNDKERCKLQNAMLKIFPLVIATSFSVEREEKIKYQYLLSQTLMRVAAKNGIDGIAYLSMKGENEFQYPQGVNLAIAANDISENNQYSKKCEGFNVSKPIRYRCQKGEGEKSYINKIYTKYSPNGFESFTSKLNVDDEIKFYGETCYAEFDDYLVSTFVGSDVVVKHFCNTST